MTTMQWRPHTTPTGDETMQATGTRGRWDVDAHGNEWTCGYSIHDARDDAESLGYELYADDGRGNGDALGTYETLAEAQAAAERHDADPHRFVARVKA